MIPFDRNKHIEGINRNWVSENKVDKKNEYIDLNTINLDLDIPLYRIMSFERLLEILDEKKLFMVHPTCWDDPYEAFLMRSPGIGKFGIVGFEQILSSIYGLCFSMKEECDGLWRNYSCNSCKNCSKSDWKKRNNKPLITVKVKTTGRKLMNAFYDIENDFHSLNYWIGKVDYSTDKISEFIGSGIEMITDSTACNLVESLLVKREAFEYEEEVRLIYVTDSTKNDSDIYSFPIEPNEVFDEIEFSPWTPEDDIDRLINRVKSKYQGKISKSKLYDYPNIRIKVD
ncbi:MAG: hypothetical protein J6V33_05570 [Bacteroidales bacterium]|nr:hypothetical protein [Bacteroidales bacterium]